MKGQCDPGEMRKITDFQLPDYGWNKEIGPRPDRRVAITTPHATIGTISFPSLEVFLLQPQAVPDRKNTTIIQPMISAAAMRIRILAFLERVMRDYE